MRDSINQHTNQSKRYYWLKLQDNFFECDEIRIIESMPNGKDYILFYLKLLLKSINQNGKLVFKSTIPYTPQMLSTITNTNIDVVRVAVDTFISLGLMEKLDDGALFMREVKKMLGSETEYAVKKREYRQEKTLSSICLDDVETKKDPVRQEIEIDTEIEKETPYSPPKLQNPALGGGDGGGGFWSGCIKHHNYQFTVEQIQAIRSWAKYKQDKNEPVSQQQVELTLKQLHDHLLANQNIVYLIETSISRGYKGIMEPTKNSVTPITVPVGKYPASEYITPETKTQKIELRNYLERCYMIEKLDPRTKEPLTSEQIALLREHFKLREKQRLSVTDFIFQAEVMTGKCLLEQALEIPTIAAA